MGLNKMTCNKCGKEIKTMAEFTRKGLCRDCYNIYYLAWQNKKRNHKNTTYIVNQIMTNKFGGNNESTKR
jgi:NMD protein affecting ribosome stability and mRNA decay